MDHITTKNRCLGFALLNSLEKQLGESFPSTEVPKWYKRAKLEPGSSSKVPLNTEFYLEVMKIVPLAGHTLKSFKPIWRQDGNKYKPKPLALYRTLQTGCYIFEMHTKGHEFVPEERGVTGAHAVSLAGVGRFRSADHRVQLGFDLDTAWKEGVMFHPLTAMDCIRTIWEVKFN